MRYFTFTKYQKQSQYVNPYLKLSNIFLAWKLSWGNKLFGNQRERYTTAWVCAAKVKKKTGTS